MAVFDQAMKLDTIAAQRQVLIKVDGFDDYFATVSGGGVTAEGTKAWDGGKMRPEVLGGPAETGNITVARPYRPMVHFPILAELEKQVGVFRTTLSVVYADPALDATRYGAVRVYADALLVGLTWPEGDASSSDAATFELEFAVDGSA